MATKMKLDREMEERLLAFVMGELEEEEAASVKEWIAQSEEHREQYEALRRDYWRLRWMQEERSIETEKAWKRISGTMERKLKSWKLLAIAACVTVFLGISGVWLLRQGEQDQIVAHEIGRIAGPQATLVLSTGQRMSLDGKQRALREQDGSSMTIDSTAGIRYKQKETDAETEEPIYNQIIVPRGGEYMVTLADGTKVWLDAESELKYPVQFQGELREVWLQGRGYFDVSKNEQTAFVVHVEEVAVKVYGTEFNVDAFREQDVVTVLVEGSVGLSFGKEREEVRLEPNQLAKVNAETGQCEVRKVNVVPYVSWKNRSIVFADERLERIMEDVSRWYDVEVFFMNEDLKELRFDCNLPRYADPREFFHFMERISDVRFDIKDHMVVVRKK